MILQVTRKVMTAILSLPPGDIYNLSVTACTERGSNTSMLHLVKLGKKKYMGVYVKTIFQGKLVFASLGFAWYSQLNAVTEKLFTVFFKCKIVYTTKEYVQLSIKFSECNVYCVGRQECSPSIVRLEEPRSLRILEIKRPRRLSSAVYSTLSDTIPFSCNYYVMFPLMSSIKIIR